MVTVDLQNSELFRNIQADSKEDFEGAFRKKMHAKQKDFHTKSMPFCSACANIDFADTKERMKADVERQLGYGPGAHVPDEVLGKIKEFQDLPNNFDYEKYTKDWDLIGETDARETRVNALGEKFNVVVGYHMNYLCKRYKHGCSMWVDRDMYEKLKGIKPAYKPKVASEAMQ
jgi:hypothetical protein